MTKTTRAAIIKKAKEYLEEREYQFGGICALFQSTIIHYFSPEKVWFTSEMSLIFPKFNKNEAKKITDSVSPYAYWWDTFDWSGDRMQFFNWLYEQYKDDETEVIL